MSLGSENWVRTWVSAMVSSGSPSTAMARPASRRAGVSPPVNFMWRRRPRLTSSWVTRWTSMDPDSAVVVTPTPRQDYHGRAYRHPVAAKPVPTQLPRAATSDRFQADPRDDLGRGTGDHGFRHGALSSGWAMAACSAARFSPGSTG